MLLNIGDNGFPQSRLTVYPGDTPISTGRVVSLPQDWVQVGSVAATPERPVSDEWSEADMKYITPGLLAKLRWCDARIDAAVKAGILDDPEGVKQFRILLRKLEDVHESNQISSSHA
jgi:hypothetical protein